MVNLSGKISWWVWKQWPLCTCIASWPWSRCLPDPQFDLWWHTRSQLSLWGSTRLSGGLKSSGPSDRLSCQPLVRKERRSQRESPNAWQSRTTLKITQMLQGLAQCISVCFTFHTSKRLTCSQWKLSHSENTLDFVKRKDWSLLFAAETGPF